MSTPLGPGTQPDRMVIFNSGADIPRGYAVELDTGAEYALNKYLSDSLDYPVTVAQLAVAGMVLGIAEKEIPADTYGDIVTKGFVLGHADDTITIEDPVVVISGGKLDNEGGTGIHSDAFFGQWMETVVAEKLGMIFFWASPLPRIAT